AAQRQPLRVATRRSADLALPVPAGDGASFAVRLAGKYQGRVTGHFVQPGREGRYAPLPEGLPERLAAALRARGVEQLYAHQARRAEEHTSELQSREKLVC